MYIKKIFKLVLLISAFILTSCCCEDELKHVDARIRNPKVKIEFIEKYGIQKEIFSNYMLRFSFETYYVKNDSIQNYIVNYASVGCGCEKQTFVDSVLNHFDSIQVFSDKQYNSNRGLNVTDIFEDRSGKRINESTDWIYGNFFIKEPPSILDTFNFTFKFFDSDGAISEFKSSKVIISK